MNRVYTSHIRFNESTVSGPVMVRGVDCEGSRASIMQVPGSRVVLDGWDMKGVQFSMRGHAGLVLTNLSMRECGNNCLVTSSENKPGMSNLLVLNGDISGPVNNDLIALHEGEGSNNRVIGTWLRNARENCVDIQAGFKGTQIIDCIMEGVGRQAITNSGTDTLVQGGTIRGCQDAAVHNKGSIVLRDMEKIEGGDSSTGTVFAREGRMEIINSNLFRSPQKSRTILRQTDGELNMHHCRIRGDDLSICKVDDPDKCDWDHNVYYVEDPEGDYWMIDGNRFRFKQIQSNFGLDLHSEVVVL